MMLYSVRWPDQRVPSRGWRQIRSSGPSGMWSAKHWTTRAVGVSERTLRRVFSAHLGMSWRSYLLRARVLRSMALLAQPDRSILEVSIAVGFDDAGAFARSFAPALRGDALRLRTTNQRLTLTPRGLGPGPPMPAPCRWPSAHSR